MALKLTGETFAEYGWGVVREDVRDPNSEDLRYFFPLKYKTGARDVANLFDSERRDGYSWFLKGVKLVGLNNVEGGQVEASFVEVSNLG